MADVLNSFFAFTSNEDMMDMFSTQKGVKEILASKYEAHNTHKVVNQQQHLFKRQKTNLGSVLNQHQVLFDLTTLFSSYLLPKVIACRIEQ